MINQVEPTDLQTYEGISVSKRINDGLTKVFTDRKAAAAYALSRGSYVYDLYAVYRKAGKTKTVHNGYAVPN